MDTLEKTLERNDNTSFFNTELEKYDEELAHVLSLEDERQSRKLIMIASESECPAPVRMALASTFTNIYAEGYPSRRMLKETTQNLPDMAEQLSFFRRFADRRYYKGVEYADVVESLACRRAAALFANDRVKAENIFVNVQPLSGAAANNAVYEAFVNPGDTVMGMDLTHGGHLTHGSPANRSGKNYNVIAYRANYETGEIDYKEVEELAHKHRPKMIIAGYSAYPRMIDWERFRKIADSCGAVLLADMAHIAGLVAGKSFPSPVGIADAVSFTTHKTLCGPRGACIITTCEEYSRLIDTAVFPGEQGGPHMNSIAAKAVLFKIAATDDFMKMQQQVLKNSRALAETFASDGMKLAYGGTDSHMSLLDLRGMKGPHGFNLRGEIASRILDMCGITCNKNTIPGDTSAVHPGALRFGTTWITQRGFKENDCIELGHTITELLKTMIPYKYIENSGDIGRAKISLDIMEETIKKVNTLIEKTDRERILPQSEYPYWLTSDPAPARKSPVLSLLRDSGAKTEDIFGWETALYFKDKEEGKENKTYLNDACNAGIFEIRGERAPYFLNELTTGLISDLKEGESTSTFIMESSGRIIDLVVIGKTGKDKFIMLTSSAKREKLLLMMRALADGYVMFDKDDIYAKIQGPVVINDLTRTPGRPVTCIKLMGENAWKDLGIKQAAISKIQIAGQDVTAVSCLSGFNCSLLISEKNSMAVWNALSDKGFEAIGYEGTENLKKINEIPQDRVEYNAWELYKSFPADIAAILFNMGKPYFIGQKFLCANMPSQLEKKSFVYEEKESEPLKTCLYDEHVKLGGRMAPFAGYTMPVWYTSINEEHRAVRSAAGLFDVSHMGIISIKGPDACRFLDTVAANYALRLFDGQSQYSYMLDQDGNILDDIMVYRKKIDDFMVVVNASNAAKINAWLKAVLSNEYIIDKECPYKQGKFNVEVKDLKNPAHGRDCKVDLALQGPASWTFLCKHLEPVESERFKRLNKNEFMETELSGVKVMISRTGYTGENYGYELYLHPDDAVKIWNYILTEGNKFGIKPCGLGARDSTRTEAGLPLYGHELEGKFKVDAIEAGYGAFVKFHKAFFIGRKAMIEKEHKRKMEIIRFKMASKNIKVVKNGSPIITKRGDMIGHVTSSVIIDGVQYGLAYVNKKYNDPQRAISVFILPAGKTTEKQKEELLPGDKVMLPEEAVILSRFPEKEEFAQIYLAANDAPELLA